MRLALILSVAASPCFSQANTSTNAQRAEFLSFLGGHGCTLSPASVDGAEAAGTPREAIREFTAAALETGDATEQGAYIVFTPSVCQIRLPDIVSKYSVDHPVIRANSPYIRETIEGDGETIVEEGCFLADATLVFAELEDFDPRAGFDAFLAFMAAGLMSGDVRFYETSPLRTPYGFQLTAGEGCDQAPNIERINASHSFLTEGFADYVRFVGRATECGDPITLEAGLFAANLQGYDHSLEAEDQQNINAWLDFEFLFITMAAGWHEGMTDVDRGTPRPPLCHY